MYSIEILRIKWKDRFVPSFWWKSLELRFFQWCQQVKLKKVGHDIFIKTNSGLVRLLKSQSLIDLSLKMRGEKWLARIESMLDQIFIAWWQNLSMWSMFSMEVGEQLQILETSIPKFLSTLPIFTQLCQQIQIKYLVLECSKSNTNSNLCL